MRQVPILMSLLTPLFTPSARKEPWGPFNGGTLLSLMAVASLGVHQDATAYSERRETPAEMRRIVAQAICLAQAYPQELAKDSAAVLAVYQGQLGKTVTVRDLEAVRSLAAQERPAAPTPVGNHNLAIARCVLFAERSDVRRLLGAKS